MRVEVPGRGVLTIERVVSDLNGTLSVDGVLSSLTRELIVKLASVIDFVVVTSDTRGVAQALFESLPVTLHLLQGAGHLEQKAALVQSLGAQTTCALGNGANDEAMLEAVALAIAVMSPEGAATKTVLASDVVVPSPEAALEFLLDETRLISGLRR